VTDGFRVAGVRVVVLDPQRESLRSDRGDGVQPPFSARLQILRPTPLVTIQKRRAIELRPIPRRPWWRGAWSLTLIAGFFIRRMFAHWTGKLTDEEDARDARRLFERLSGMWIKLGQLLSLRTDILSDAMCRELASLQYEISGFPSAVAMEVLAADLGVPIGSVFSHVEARPFAAASVCQVHRANLRDKNRAVVIKIMRPDVRHAFEGDLRLLRALAFLINMLGLGGRLNLREGIKELSSVLREEADYTNELLNLRQMRKGLKSHGIIVPRCYPRLCSSRVLVMEEIPGVLMSEYIRQRQENTSSVREWERQNGIERDRVARLLLITALRQILDDNLFHGDLHPGNILLLRDNRVALIDFGSIGRLPGPVWQTYREMTNSIAVGDYERAADYMLLLGGSVPAFGAGELRAGLAEIFRQWGARSQLDTLPYAQRSMASTSIDTARLMAEYNVPATWGMLRVGRALSTLDASLQVLAPDGNFMRLYKAYFRDRQKRSASLAGRKEALQNTVQQFAQIRGDLKVLLLPKIRQLALLERGMADTKTKAKIAVLTKVRQGLFGLVALTGLALLVQKQGAFIAAHTPGMLAPIVVEPLASIGDAVRDVPLMGFLIVGAFCLFLAHILGAVRRYMVSRD
jgi:ubiquinone biosynthesis protein